MKVFFICLVIIVLIGLFIYYYKTHKTLYTPSVFNVTGAVKTGKSTLAIYLAIQKYKKRLFLYYLMAPFRKLFKKTKEKPLFYTNTPILLYTSCYTRKSLRNWKKFDDLEVHKDFISKFQHSVNKNNIKWVTTDILERKKRINYGSVCYCGEGSLIADSMSIKDKELNEQLLLFNKLFGHETNGLLFYDTQCLLDLHYNIKRCTNNYVWIHHNIKIPFFIILFVREMSYDSNVENSINEDVSETLKWLVVPKSIWKHFDYRCYSALTDNLEISSENVVFNDKMKCHNIVTFKNRFKTLEKKEENICQKEK